MFVSGIARFVYREAPPEARCYAYIRMHGMCVMASWVLDLEAATHLFVLRLLKNAPPASPLASAACAILFLGLVACGLWLSD